jgi:hypothetical protein
MDGDGTFQMPESNMGTTEEKIFHDQNVNARNANSCGKVRMSVAVRPNDDFWRKTTAQQTNGILSYMQVSSFVQSTNLETRVVVLGSCAIKR